MQEMLKDLLGDTLQGMLEAEMDKKLGCSKYDYRNKETDDSRNGYSKKTVAFSLGNIDLDIPAIMWKIKTPQGICQRCLRSSFGERPLYQRKFCWQTSSL